MNNGKYLEIWTIYQSAWAPIGVDERRELLAKSVASDVVYTDPGSQVHGMEALAERIGQSQVRYPGARFRNDSFLAHHDQAIFRWVMLNGDGTEAVTGMSYARFGTDGRLEQATGFFETGG